MTTTFLYMVVKGAWDMSKGLIDRVIEGNFQMASRPAGHVTT